MPYRFLLLLLTLVLQMIGCSQEVPDAGSLATQESTVVLSDSALPVGIDWHSGSVEEAFAAAKASNKPIFLYWGATWCPYCNQVKATVFTRRNFIDRSRQFVPVYLDGDQPAAQKAGERFRVAGYPTMIVFNAEGNEITRIPGGLNIEAYSEILDLSLSAVRSAKDIVVAILAADHVPGDDYRRLAYYSWGQDNEGILKDREPVPMFASIVDRCPASEPIACQRLYLIFLSMTVSALDEEGGPEVLTMAERREAVSRLTAMLDDEALSNASIDTILYEAADFVGASTTPNSAERALLERLWLAAAKRLADDPAVSTTEQLYASYAPVEFLKLNEPEATIPDGIKTSIRQRVKRALEDTTDSIERHSVIVTASRLLRAVDLESEAVQLLESELDTSAQPYYLMSALASNAERNDQIDEAIEWRRRAYEEATGETTKFRWGVNYVSSLVKLAPDDGTAIETAAKTLFDDITDPKDAFYGSTRVRAEQLFATLSEWSASYNKPLALDRIREHAKSICSQIPVYEPAHQNCTDLLTTEQG